MERTEYWAEVKTIARDLADEIRDESVENEWDEDDARDALYERVHERVDGHEWIIYTQHHFSVLDHSDNDGYSVENFGAESIVQDGALNTAALAYGALYGDVMDELSGLDSDDLVDADGQYAARVKAGLDGLRAVSTGLCSGCDECRGTDDRYTVVDSDEADDRFTFEASDGETWDSDDAAEQAAQRAFDDALSCGEVYAEPSFSWSGCGICGSSLGGDLEPWHAVDSDDVLRHFDDACTDCVQFLANGTMPSERA